MTTATHVVQNSVRRFLCKFCGRKVGKGSANVCMGCVLKVENGSLEVFDF